MIEIYVDSQKWIKNILSCLFPGPESLRRKKKRNVCMRKSLKRSIEVLRAGEVLPLCGGLSNEKISSHLYVRTIVYLKLSPYSLWREFTWRSLYALSERTTRETLQDMYKVCYTSSAYVRRQAVPRYKLRPKLVIFLIFKVYIDCCELYKFQFRPLHPENRVASNIS